MAIVGIRLAHGVRAALNFYMGKHTPERKDFIMDTGEAGSFASVEAWPRETKQLGQVATPQRIADLMAKRVMSGRPRTLLDPAAGLGGFPLQPSGLCHSDACGTKPE